MHKKYWRYRQLRQGNVFCGDHQMAFCQAPILMQDNCFQIKGFLQPADILFVQTLNAGNHAGVYGYDQGIRSFFSADEMASKTISPCTR